MRAALAASVLAVVALTTAAAAGAFGGGSYPVVVKGAAPPPSPKRPTVTYRAQGVRLTTPRPGFRASVPNTGVIALFRRSHLAGAQGGKLRIHPWMVRDGHPGRGSPYPAWVVTVPQTRDCTFVAIYNLWSLAWTDDFRSCQA